MKVSFNLVKTNYKKFKTFINDVIQETREYNKECNVFSEIKRNLFYRKEPSVSKKVDMPETKSSDGKVAKKSVISSLETWAKMKNLNVVVHNQKK